MDHLTSIATSMFYQLHNHNLNAQFPTTAAYLQYAPAYPRHMAVSENGVKHKSSMIQSKIHKTTHQCAMIFQSPFRPWLFLPEGLNLTQPKGFYRQLLGIPSVLVAPHKQTHPMTPAVLQLLPCHLTQRILNQIPCDRYPAQNHRLRIASGQATASFHPV